VLSGEVEPLPAAHRHLQVRTGLKQFHHRRRCLDHLLEIIQQEQQALITETGFQKLKWRPLAGLLDP
jgi:hypothetical protein